MRVLLLAAFGVAAALSHSAAASPRLETLFTSKGRVAALAQDDGAIAWFATGSGSRCNALTVSSIANGTKVQLPQQGTARNVTCLWRVGATPVELALAGTTVAWTLRQDAPIPFDWLLGASVGSRKERRFQELAHTKRGVGIWLGGVAGDGDTLVYGIANVDYVDEAGCLAGTGTCELETTGGGLYRMSGRQTPKLIPGTSDNGAVAVAASEEAVAYVPSAGVAKNGQPIAGADLPIEIVDASTGSSVANVAPQGVPIALTLTHSYLVTLERTTASGVRLAWYDRATGIARGSVVVPAAASAEVSASDRTAVYRVGQTIHGVDLATAKDRTLVTAAAAPVGLSIEGRRVAWAENLKGSARIRALTLTQ
jgi:hypothetical protein